MNNLKKFQRKNLNKFIYLKKKHNNNHVVSSKSLSMKNNILEMVDFLLRKTLSLKSLIVINCNKTKTKKPLGAKLGGGKGKIDYFYKILRKYQPIILNKKSPRLKSSLEILNKIL